MSSPWKRAGKLSPRDIACLGLLAAMMVSGQVAMASIPNIEPVSLIIIAGSMVFGRKMLLAVYAFAAAEIFIYGPGLWAVNYLYVWAVLCLVTVPLRNIKGRLFWAVVSGFYGLFFGLLCAIPYIFISGIAGAVGWYIKGIPFDILHCGGNFAMAFFLLPACRRLLERLRGSEN